MLNLLTSEQTRAVDLYTVRNKPIQSIDLMERASLAFVESFVKNYPDTTKRIAIYCGTGNNGGDGLAVARILNSRGYLADVKIARFSGKSTSDFDSNLARLMSQGIVFDEFRRMSELKEEKADILIDALLGSGLNKPLEGPWLTLVEWLNSLGRPIVSIDTPTGFSTEGPVSKHDVTIKADLVITFQRPKINFLLPESELCIKRFEVVDIGLDEEYIQALDTPYKLITQYDITRILKRRRTFSHKGTFGHALIVAGQPQTIGAALLATEACLNAGAGLTSAYIPIDGLTALNIRVPEAMALLRVDEEPLAGLDKFTSIAIGPGLGTSTQSSALLSGLLARFRKAVVIDADGLNILAKDGGPTLADLSEGTLLTPHVKEFDRLFGEHENWWERLETGRKKAEESHIVIVLKNRFTIVFTPDGRCLFNPTGTPAMASGGMGDVLTGIIAAFLAQGYKPEQAAILSVYLHGETGQEEVRQHGSYVVPASHVAKKISETIGRFI